MKQVLFILCVITLVFYSCQDSPGKTPEPTPEPSPCPEAPPLVTGVEASCLEYTDMIRVTWDHAEGAESYKVYRYLHKSPGSLDAEIEHTTNDFEDDTAIAETPYFYRVASVIGSETSELSANYVKGIYSTMPDLFEPNDDKSHAQEVSGIEPPQPTPEPNAVMYSFYLGEAQDTDWYKYAGDYMMVKIWVILPSGSPFSGNLTLQIENGNNKTLLEGENELSYTKDENDLYFFIELTVPDPEIDKTGMYTVFLELIA